MTYQITILFTNEDTGARSEYLFNGNLYQTEALPLYLARKDLCGEALVVSAADAYVKPARKIKVKGGKPDTYDAYHYGSAEHQLFGDAWLFADLINGGN